MCKEKWAMTLDKVDELYDLWCKEDRYCMLHPGMQCKIILCTNGDTYAYYDAAGSTSIPVSVWEGKDVELFTICYQHMDIEDDFSYTSFEEWLDDHDIDYDHDMDCRELREFLCSEYDAFCEEIVDDFITDHDTPYTLFEEVEDTSIAHIVHDWAYGEGAGTV